MFLIFGTNERISTTPKPDIMYNACPKCSSNMVSMEVKTWLTFFFIPVFPVNTKRSVYQCENCGSSFHNR